MGGGVGAGVGEGVGAGVGGEVGFGVGAGVGTVNMIMSSSIHWLPLGGLAVIMVVTETFSFVQRLVDTSSVTQIGRLNPSF